MNSGLRTKLKGIGKCQEMRAWKVGLGGVASASWRSEKVEVMAVSAESWTLN